MPTARFWCLASVIGLLSRVIVVLFLLEIGGEGVVHIYCHAFPDFVHFVGDVALSKHKKAMMSLT